MSYNIFERWPFTSYENLNLSWILRRVDEAWKMAKKASELDVQTAINNKIDELLQAGELGAILQPFGYGGFIAYHIYDHTGDTSWIMTAIPRNAYKLVFHNCSGNDSDSPTTLASDPETWLKNYGEAHHAILAHNCNFGGAQWGSRWNGVNYPRDIDPSVYPTPRNYFAYDSITEECAYFDSTTPVNLIPENYDVVFACGDWFIIDGSARTSPYTLDNAAGPRSCFGWDDEHFYVLYAEGRGTYEKGLTLAEAQATFIRFGVPNAVNFDGGGSVCLAANMAGGTMKINHFRDARNYPFSQNRPVGLCATYERRIENNDELPY